MASFSGKVVAVTGAASGIGKAMAQLLASRGATLALADVQEGPLEEFAKSLGTTDGQQVMHTRVDVQKTEEVNAWFEQIVKTHGRIDGAANIAGVVHRPVSLRDMDDDVWEWTMGVNSTGVFKCLRAELNNMKAGSAIVSISSVAGLMGLKNTGAYVASKHAVIGLTKTAAKEGGPLGIRVNAVAPGFINTPMLAKAAEMAAKQPEAEKSGISMDSVPLGRVAQPEEVAKLLAYLLSDDASYVSGEIVRVDGGWLG